MQARPGDELLKQVDCDVRHDKGFEAIQLESTWNHLLLH